MAKHKILTVDDEEFNLDILKEYLEEAEYQVVTATDGLEALACIEQHHDFDCIVLDRMMPNMNGMEFLAKIKEDKRYSNIPVIMQTAAASTKQIQEGIDAGVYYYLAKPYDQEILISIVKSAVEDFKLRKSLAEEVEKSRITLGLLESARFEFRTLEEANNLSFFIANCFPEPDNVIYGLNELMINAVEHGNLGITYDEKSEMLFEGILFDEIAKRLTMDEYKARRAHLEFNEKDTYYEVTISDEGAGFDWKEYIDFSPSRATDPNGRGIAIAKIRSFDEINYQGIGNVVKCRVNKKATF